MAFAILGTPKPAFFDSSGAPLAGGTLAVLDPADDTNKASYATYDEAEVPENPNSNPITLDARGECDLWGLDGEDYKLVLKDVNGDTIWTTDDVFLPNFGNYYAITSAETSAGVTPTNYQYEPGDVRRYGVVADSNGTTGNGTDDTTAWTNAVTACLQGGYLMVGPPGTSRITSPVEMGKVNAVFHGLLYNDNDGEGVTITNAGSTFTILRDIKVKGNTGGTSTSHGISVVDSRVMILGRCTSNTNSGCGYHHLDDDGNSNHSIIELNCDNNDSHGHYIKKGVTGGNVNNWTVKLGAFSNGGDGVLIDADVKYMRGTIQAEDNTGTGLNADLGSSWDLDVYLETNTVTDYDFSAAVGSMSIRGRLGSGNDNSTEQTVLLSYGGNNSLLKGDTPLWRKCSANNVGNSGAEYIRDEWIGSSAEKLADFRVYGNTDWAIRSYNRTTEAVTGVFDYDQSKGMFSFGDGTDSVYLYAGANLSRSTPTATTAQLEDITHTVNTHESKVEGSQIFDTTANIPMYATGANNNSTWVGEQAGSTITLTPV